METLSKSALARADLIEAPKLEALERGLDRSLASYANPEALVSQWLTSRWNISGRMASSSDSSSMPRLDGKEVAIGWRRYEGSAANMIDAAQELRRTAPPASPGKLAGMLATMNATLVQSRQSEAETRLRVAAYVDRLAEYPADVVAAVLRAWPDNNKFWPAWFELREELERIARPRRELIRDLELAAVTLEPERRKTMVAFALKRVDDA